MEEYRAIAKRILVPSFFSMLGAGSAVFLTYSFLFDSKVKIAIGFFCLLLSLLALLFHLRFELFFPSQKTIEVKNNAFKRSKHLNKIKISHSGYLYHISITILIIIAAVYRVLSLTQHSPVSGSAAEFNGIVESVKAMRYTNEIVIAFTEADKNNNEYYIPPNKAISYTDKEIQINPGDELIITAKAIKIGSDNKNISSFERGLLRKGYHFIFYLNDKNFKVSKRASLNFKDRIRNLIENNLRKLFDEKTVPILKGLYFANGSFIDKATISDFKRAGVLHILAASGEHVGIIAAVLLILLNPLLINRKIIRIIICAILFFYLYISDMPVSLLRAFVMYYIYSMQYFFDFDKNILNTLFLSAIIILLINPYELYALGFQLSFGATFGIIVFYNFYKETFSFLPVKIYRLMSVTFSAQAVVFPVIFIQLKEINLTGLMSNIVLVFTMSVTLISSLAVNIVSVASAQVAKHMAIITDISYSVSLRIIQYLSGISGHFVSEKWYLLILPYLLFLFPVIPVIKNRKLVLFSLAFSVIFSWTILSAGYSSANSKIAVYRKDNSSLVLLKNKNDNFIYGTLESKADAEEIAGYCNGNNIKNIILCISSPDYNNLKSYSYFIKKTIVAECIISPDFMFFDHFKKFCKTLDADGIKLRILKFKKYNEIAVNEDMVAFPGFIKNFSESPIEKISKMHFLLLKDYNKKNSIISEISENGYEIEYIK